MGILLFLLGILLLAGILVDIFTTTLTARGGGFVTNRVAVALWGVALSVHQRRSAPQLLTTMGPLITASVVLIWVAAMWAGWSLIFSAGATGVVEAQSGQPADAWSRIYYAGFTLFTLGVGDYRPSGAPWQMLTALCVANGLLTLTLSVTYFVPVVSAATRKRQLAASISSFGMRPSQIVANGWTDGSFDRLMFQLASLNGMISQQAQEHLAYPVLAYFYSAEDELALAPRLAALDEALQLMRHAVAPEARPAEVDLRPLTGGIGVYIQTLGSNYVSAGLEEPPMPMLAALRDAGIPLNDEKHIELGFRQEAQRRRMLLGLVLNDGHDWPAG